jgi:RNA polymerase sigma-70 factor (ECF subfamily)
MRTAVAEIQIKRRILFRRDNNFLETTGRRRVMQAGDRVERERELRRAVLAGEEFAWRTLYDESFAGMYAYVLWRCGGLRDRADELVQETWLTAVRRLRAFDPSAGSFASWLRGIAANVLRNHFRKEKRRARRTQPLESEQLAVEESQEQAERIAAALASLPEHYEAVLRMKYLESRSVADIAAERGDSLKAVESQLTRAREAFRQAYLQLE